MDKMKIIEERINNEVKVDTVKYLQAKSFILNYEEKLDDEVIDVPTALNHFIALNGISKLTKFVIYNEEDLNNNQMSSIKSYYECSVAFCEAVLSLINSTIYIKFDALFALDIGLPYTNVSNQTGIEGYLTFKRFKMQCPLRIKRSFSSLNQEFIFADPDIYTLEINIPNAHAEVIDALKDCILCFRNELYRPAVTMLGKAVEGAWIELGISLLKFVESKKEDAQKTIDKFMGKEDFVWKLDQVIKLYNRQDWFEVISKKSGIKPAHLNEIYFWTEVVRDSRNAIHFGVEPTTPNTYDKSSILLMLAVKHLRTLYKLKATIDE